MHKNNIGLYIHIPFCEKKCAYCDFYSCIPSDRLLNEYLSSLILQIKQWGGKLNRPIDTIYIGGGTPSLLSDRIIPLIDAIRENFRVCENAEITAELNPTFSDGFLRYAKQAGVNRISVGVQSGSDSTLKALGRSHTAYDAQKTVDLARKTGFDNISVDLMIGLPDSSLKSLESDIDFILSLNPQHISAYILKIEQNTKFLKIADSLNLPDDDTVAQHYLYMCERLENAGFEHYEISNFSKPDCESRHNLKYWQCREYLGIGASAHSFLNGERFYYPRDIKGFISSPQIISDGNGGSREEKLMLSLRLKKGVDLTEIFGEIPQNLLYKISALQKAGYINADLPRISLTDSGMLISNSIITELL